MAAPLPTGLTLTVLDQRSGTPKDRLQTLRIRKAPKVPSAAWDGVMENDQPDPLLWI